MTYNVINISKHLLNEPIKILLKNSEISVDLIKQFYVDVEHEHTKFDTLMDLYSVISTSQTIIFVNTIKKVYWLKESLEQKKIEITYTWKIINY